MAGDLEQSVHALGIDGGGTKTEAWLASLDANGETRVLGRGSSGSSNPRAVGFETATENLAVAIDSAWRDAGQAPRSVDCAVFAISGAGHISMQERITAWARERGVASEIRIEHDVEPVLAAGTPEGWGVGLIVGTGSAAIAVNRERVRQIAGGWGYWFGDEGSAFWLGRHALAAVARAADGRGEPTALSAAFRERLGVDDPRAMLGALEKRGDVRFAIAKLADAVGRAAAEGDAAAVRIIDAATEELADMVASAAAKLSLGREFPLALAGGVACGSDLLRQRLLAALATRNLAPHPVTLVPHPVEGCLRLARRALQSPS